jgi:hypothetical protein
MYQTNLMNRLSQCFRLSLRFRLNQMSLGLSVLMYQQSLKTQYFRLNQQNLMSLKFLMNRLSLRFHLNLRFRLSQMNPCFHSNQQNLPSLKFLKNRLSQLNRLSLKNQSNHLNQMSLG